jgi:SAM-dependent methyltransferase
MLRRLGLLRPAFRLYELGSSIGGDRRATGSDGLPLPPPKLRMLVAGSADADSFLRRGAEAAQTIRAVLGRHGVVLEDCDALLDFGCGSGRVARHWKDLSGPEVHGCDANPELVRWCQENLPFLQARVSGLEPPLPYEADSFDVLYALSVFTHLPEAIQRPWLEELQRVLRPGGHVFFTTHGEAYLYRLDDEERERFHRGELIVHFEELAGANLCSAFHPEEYVRAVLPAGLELLEVGPAGAAGTGKQDFYLARKFI